MCQKCEGKSVLWDNFFFLTEKNYAENMKKKWREPFGSCLLNTTFNPAHFHPNEAELSDFFALILCSFLVRTLQNIRLPVQKLSSKAAW